MKMRGTLTERPLWRESPTIDNLDLFQEVFTMPTPPLPAKVGRKRILTEENSHYPIGKNVKIDWEKRKFDRRQLQLEGYQHARGAASRENDKQQYAGLITIATASAVVILTLVFALILVSSVVDKRAQDAETATSMRGR